MNRPLATLWACVPLLLAACSSSTDAGAPGGSAGTAGTGGSGGDAAVVDATSEEASVTDAASEDAVAPDGDAADAGDAGDAASDAGASDATLAHDVVQYEAGPYDAGPVTDGGAPGCFDGSVPTMAPYDGGGAVVVRVPSTTVDTFAGSGTGGGADGVGAVAQFDNPVNLAIASNGSIVVSDFDGASLRWIDPQASVSTFTAQSGFSKPFGIAFDANSRLWVQTDSDPSGNKTLQTGTLWFVDGTGVPTPVVSHAGRPRGLAALADGRIALSDPFHHTLSLFNPDGATIAPLAGSACGAGFVDGNASTARFSRPYGLATLPGGDLIVADMMNHALRRVTLAGYVSTYAGDGTPGHVDGPLATARFAAPEDVAVDAAGNIYVSDGANHCIRRIDTNGDVTTVAGTGAAGGTDGAGDVATFFGQEGLDVSPDGHTIFVADGNGGDGAQPYHRIRRITIP